MLASPPAPQPSAAPLSAGARPGRPREDGDPRPRQGEAAVAGAARGGGELRAPGSGWLEAHGLFWPFSPSDSRSAFERRVGEVAPRGMGGMRLRLRGTRPVGWQRPGMPGDLGGRRCGQALVMGRRQPGPLGEEGSEEKPKPAARGGLHPARGARAPTPSLRALPVRPCLDRSPGPVTLTQLRRRQPGPAFFGKFLHIPLLKPSLPRQGCRPLPFSGGVDWGGAGGAPVQAAPFGQPHLGGRAWPLPAPPATPLHLFR